jgi:dephospho-CoA kinase
VFRVGLTGGIASGKSVVLRRLSARGLATLDLDEVAHAVMAPGGAAHDDVVEAFGRGILAPDGTIDRQTLGAIVFRDASALRRLDALVHPRVRDEEARRVALLEAEGHELVVSDAALLVEAGVHLRFDRLVVVHCPPDEQRHRLIAREGISRSAAQARLDAQMPIAEKRRFAHLDVDSSGSLEDTAGRADVLAGVLLTEARGPRPPGLRPERALGALARLRTTGPRGLAPRALLELACERGGLEMSALARALRPPGEGPWYRVARPEEAGPWPEALAVPLALWALARGADDEWLLAAAASLARLTHRGDETVAGACLAALAAREVASAGRLHPLEDRSGDGEERARRWGGGRPAGRVRRALDAALARGGDPVGAADTALATGGEPSLAAGLVGLTLGPSSEPEPALESLVERLCPRDR